MALDKTPTLDDSLTITQVLPVVSRLAAGATADDHARAVGLVYVDDQEPGIQRLRWGGGFTYRTPEGETIARGSPERARIEALAIPPAWIDVWICRDARGHIQATGFDEAGRKQYRYHDRWREVRDATKFHRMAGFADALPRIRDTVDSHLRKHDLGRDKVLAMMVALLDETLIRIGNEQYARVSGSRGLTTLRCEDLEVGGNTVNLTFPAKGGDEHTVALTNRRLARQLLRCEEIPGQRLFAYFENDEWLPVDSGAVNEYLREAAGCDCTAKDFRTWGGTVAVAETLHEIGPPASEREAESNILQAVDAAAERLGNTRAVARASYVDPRVPKAYRLGRFDEVWDDDGLVDRRSAAERAVQRVLHLRMPPSVSRRAS